MDVGSAAFVDARRPVARADGWNWGLITSLLSCVVFWVALATALVVLL